MFFKAIESSSLHFGFLLEFLLLFLFPLPLYFSRSSLELSHLWVNWFSSIWYNTCQIEITVLNPRCCLIHQKHSVRFSCLCRNVGFCFQNLIRYPKSLSENKLCLSTLGVILDRSSVKCSYLLPFGKWSLQTWRTTFWIDGSKIRRVTSTSVSYIEF